MTPTPCPGREQLSSFQVGRLPAPALDAIAEHVDSCPHCSSALEELEGSSDPLLAGLRAPVPPDPLSASESQRVAALVEALGAARRQSAVLAEHTADHALLGQLGQYELLEKLGQGGMGQVFKARHRLMDRVVALKVIHQERLARPKAVERFQREIRTLARLDHPNIVRAEYADEAGGRHFLVMEYVAGVNLAELVRRSGPLRVPLACECARQAALALQHAHEHGLVHRDVKPSNLILSQAPGLQPLGLIKLLDLGLARLQHEPAEAGEVTSAGQALGTHDYMAPEQWDDARAVDIRADLYSLGCTLYHLLTGRPPFAGPGHASALQKMKAHAEAPVPSIRDRRSDVPEALAAVLDRLLAKDPARRFATPVEVAAALEPFTAGWDLGETCNAPAAADVLAAETLPERPATRSTDTRPAGRPFPRRAVLPLALAVLGVLIVTAVVWKLALSPDNSVTSRPDLPTTEPQGTRRNGPVLPAPVKVRIELMQLEHYRGNPAELLGNLGGTSRVAQFDDDVRVSVRLDRSGYCYLIAFNPDGKEQFCYPEDGPAAVPPRVQEFPYPAEGYFALTDGVGLQAFVLVASAEPLPSYEEWIKRHGRPPWQAVQGRGIWRFDAGGFTLLKVERGPPRQKGGPPRALEELCAFFRKHAGQAEVRVMAFPVKAKP